MKFKAFLLWTPAVWCLLLGLHGLAHGAEPVTVCTEIQADDAIRDVATRTIREGFGSMEGVRLLECDQADYRIKIRIMAITPEDEEPSMFVGSYIILTPVDMGAVSRDLRSRYGRWHAAKSYEYVIQNYVGSGLAAYSNVERLCRDLVEAVGGDLTAPGS